MCVLISFHCNGFFWQNVTVMPEFGSAIVWSWNNFVARSFISTSKTIVERTFKLASAQKSVIYVTYVMYSLFKVHS